MHEEKIKRLASMKKSAESGGGNDKIEAQHSKGKLTARERIALLLDEGSFVELDKYVMHRSDDPAIPKFFGDGAVTGFGTIGGRQVFVFSYDFTVLGGSLGEMTGKKIAKAMDHALKVGCPIIGIIDSGGARIQEGVASLDAYGDIFFRNTMASGVIPQITASIGPCAGGAVYSPAMTDFVIMVENIGQMFVTGPEVVKEVLSQEVSFEELGGARAHATKSGVAHFVAKNEYDCFDKIKKLLSFLPQNNAEDPSIVETNDDPNRIDTNLVNILPENPYQQYDMKDIIKSIVDNADFFEVHEFVAENIVVGFAYGGAYIAMGSKNLRSDINYAWPTAEIAVLGPEAAITIIHRRDLKSSADAVARKKQLAKEYRDKFANPYIAAEKGTIDVVIDPAETRSFIIQALNALANKKEPRPWKKHGNINL